MKEVALEMSPKGWKDKIITKISVMYNFKWHYYIYQLMSEDKKEESPLSRKYTMSKGKG